MTRTNAPNALASDETSYAATIPGRIDLPVFGAKDIIRCQATYAHDVTRFIQETFGVSPSGFYDPATRRAEAQKTSGGHVAFQHWWTNEPSSKLVYSYVRSDLPRFAAATTFKHSEYGAANLIWSPLPDLVLDLGVDLFYGLRQGKDGATGTQTRLRSSVTYRF